MFDKESFANYLSTLSKVRFDALCRLILSRFYGLDVTNIDGKGDGGADFCILPVAGGRRVFVSQITIQKSNWKSKAMTDAGKAVETYKCTRYIFLTARVRTSTELHDLDQSVLTKYGIPASCLGGTEIADIVISRGLLEQALDDMGIPHIPSSRTRTDRQEMLVHSYIAIGGQPAELRDQVYDDTLLLVIHDLGPMHDQQLVEEAIRWLGCDVGREGRMMGRKSSLLTRGLIIKNKATDKLELAPVITTDIKSAERIYSSELDSLSSAQASLLDAEFGLQWPRDDALKCSVLLARAFVARQLETVQAARATLNRLHFTHIIGDPLQELRDHLATTGVPVKGINKVVEEMVNNAASSPLIQKLARGTLYAALEGQSVLQMSRALGVTSWSQVTVYVDASVLIPYICAKLYSPTVGRFSQGAISCLRSLISSGAKLVTTQDYINEAASHLLKALEYVGAHDADEYLQYSKNGYVSHYYQLKLQGQDVPANLVQFLSKFSRAVLNEQEQNAWVRAVMPELVRLAGDYQVGYETITSPVAQFSDGVDRLYGHALSERNRDRVGLLVRHDARTISYLRKLVSEGHCVMCLTWDRLMIEVGGKLDDCGWIVSPHDAVDFIQTSKPPIGDKLISLAHRLAAVREGPCCIVGELIDTLVEHAKTDKLDWQFREKIEELRVQMQARFDLDGSNFEDWARQEAHSLLKNAGVFDKEPEGE